MHLGIPPPETVVNLHIYICMYIHIIVCINIHIHVHIHICVRNDAIDNAQHAIRDSDIQTQQRYKYDGLVANVF